MSQKIKRTITKIIAIPRIFNQKEMALARIFVFLIILSSLGLLINIHLSSTRILPNNGGIYREAIIGYPQYLNPILSYSSDTDRDIVKLIYSGLTKFDPDGNIVPDLAEDFIIDDSGKNYTFYLRKNIYWHNNIPFSVDDIVFTIKTIQNPEYNSPLRFNWDGVEIEKINDLTVRFKLKNPYAPFLTNTTVGILPKHIWENLSPRDFYLSKANLEPIGTGPFKFDNIKKGTGKIIETLTIERNNQYYLKKPYLEKLIFVFQNGEKKLIEALNQNKVDAIALGSGFYKKNIKKQERFNFYSPLLPRYFAAFINQEKNSLLANQNVRIALSYATNKELIIKEVFNDEALRIEGPFPQYLLPEKHSSSSSIYEYNLDKAKKYLEKINKESLNIVLTFPDIPELAKTAEILQSSWQEAGFRVKISLVPPTEIIDSIIRQRNYEILIFGQVLNLDPDPFSFWHSSQKNDPGLNLSLYQNKAVDAILKNARGELDAEKRLKLYGDLSSQITKDIPAVFLYSPKYLYVVNDKIKGIKTTKINLPADRFASVENWYIETRRVKK
ncbi:MAG: ABC transporter substrate-binding protein [Candidatus Paceibacterota bacterium]|jgi:peptide/nickel transport system substrate-binding protein